MSFTSSSLSLPGMFEIFDIVEGVLHMKNRKNPNESDRENTIVCNEYILNVMADADTTRTVEAVTGKELREQMTVEQAIALHN